MPGLLLRRASSTWDRRGNRLEYFRPGRWPWTPSVGASEESEFGGSRPRALNAARKKTAAKRTAIPFQGVQRPSPCHEFIKMRLAVLTMLSSSMSRFRDESSTHRDGILGTVPGQRVHQRLNGGTWCGK